MKNSKLRRILLTLACAVLLVSLSVGATLAYLTSTTGVVENTFTVGKVQIDLDEADVNEYGELVYVEKDGERVLADRVLENEYKLVPSHTYIKDPTVYVIDESEPCYVFVKVENGMSDYLVDNDIHAQMEAKGWVLNGNTGVYYYNGEYAVDAIVDAREAQIDLIVFETITLKTGLTKDDLAIAKDKKITVQAYAIQADGFESPEDAWTAYTTQNH